ncbi:MAG TPA: beta-ketoacyl synthase N-terminal-like domain-containing protein [Stellaceae bacterium]|jgi:3-oxoacyl-(acyl-carrier-protein) synthase/NADPH:quinone reductase-like Zn-dependent oxidoreductase/SAM-dependent methyltransferase
MTGKIAIIGMAGRFPGAPDLPAFWELLVNGREGLVRLERDELLAEGVPAAVLDDQRYVPAAGVLDGIDRFDAGFWGIAAQEAALMDPQQRIALEIAWHALEDAAIDPRRADGAIGVFVGAAISTYLLTRLRGEIAGPSAPSQLLAMIGNDKDYIATQLAYRLDLTGPAIAVQTACSSSLVAVHLACQSLNAGECDIAIAGGVSVRVPHRVGYLCEAGGMLSPDGHCRSFAEDAAGTVFGSGCGLVVLRRLEDASRDRVRALVLGSAVNNDGNRKVGFTAPSQDRQSAVIAEAMAVAGVAPRDTGYVEGHGTATELGDPVEVMALASAFRSGAPGTVPLGSAKSAIGHTETAAGVAGLIKTVLMLEQGTIAPTLHAACPSPRIPWRDTPFRLASEVLPWTERRIAGVSSFGIGGTNAHVVLAPAPPARAAARQIAPRLLISAQDRVSLAELAQRYGTRLAARPEDFPAICAAAARRPRLSWWVAADHPDALAEAAPRTGPMPDPMPDPPGSSDGSAADLPLYPFRRDRHWYAAAAETRFLGPAIPTPFAAALHRVAIDGSQRGWLAQHVVCGERLLPAALHLALFAEAADGAVADATIRVSLSLDKTAELQLWRAADGGLKIMAQQDDEWLCLAEARTGGRGVRVAPWQVGSGESIDGIAWAKTMAGAGLDFGPAFRLIAGLWRDGGAVRAELDPTAPANPVTVIDAGLQALGAGVIERKTHFRPVEIARLSLRGDIATARTILARLTSDSEEAKSGDVLWLDQGGEAVAAAEGVVCRPVDDRAGDMLYRLTWRPDLDHRVTAPYPALERIAQSFARRALAAVPSPARPELARLLGGHAAPAEGVMADPETACRALAARFPDHAAEIELVARCGAALADVLAGRLDPLELLFGAREGAEGAYRLSPLARELNRVAGAVAAAARPRRVIEIGGGTTATALALRAALPEVAEYLFTDISAAFLAEARQRFAGWPGFSTAVLDISCDPAEQGVPVGGWDLVVAANVLHAAPDLAAALAHACRLLAPGGRLLLIEGTEASARLDMTFGLTEGWSQRRNDRLRPEHPLVSAAVWSELLRDAGLAEPVIVAELGGQAVLTAAAGPPSWVAVGCDPQAARTLGLPFLALGAMLAAERLDGVVALAGLEDAADPLRDLLALSRALLHRPDAPRLLLPTRQSEALTSVDRPVSTRAALGGFLRTLAREHPALRPRTIAVAEADLPAAMAIERMLDDGEDRVAWRDGKRLVARLDRLPQTPRPPAGVRLGPDLSLMPVEVPGPGPGEVVVRVRAAGINYKDALTAAGQLPEAGAGLGGECAGEIAEIGPGVTGLSPGQAVVAVAGGALASHVRADAQLVLPKPPQLDFARAAVVPIAGVTARYALHHLARIAPGQRVLVHSATGGVGWFALRFAQAAGCEVVATAGSEAKRQVLAGLGIREIYSSRDTAFAAAAPVDVVLNALPGAARDAGLRLVRPGGHFVEIGRVGVAGPEEVAALRPDIAYHVVALDRASAPVFAVLLREVIEAVAADPSLLPPVTTVPLAEARGALERMMRAEHVGKLAALPAVPPTIRSDGSYVVTGGLGGLGPEIAGWLTRRGAGGVVLVARRPPAGSAPGNAVIGDVADPATLRAVDARARDFGLPPVRGVVHAAGVLEDSLIEALDPASFDRVMAPKLGGVRAILDHWPDLDLLIGFSSAGALFGSAGQAAHTAASAALDAALAAAATAGRTAVTVDWGAWRERGAAAARDIDGRLAAGMGSIATAEGFAALDRVLASRVAQAAVLPIDWPAMRASGAVPALLRDLARTNDEVAAAPARPSPAPPEAEPMPAEERREWLRERIAAECAGMLAIQGAIDPRRPLRELGLDSLAALELRNRLGRLCAAVLPAGLLFDYPTIAALTEHLATAYLGLPAERAPQPPSPDRAEDALADASDAELDAAISAFAALHGEAEA